MIGYLIFLIFRRAFDRGKEELLELYVSPINLSTMVESGNRGSQDYKQAIHDKLLDL